MFVDARTLSDGEAIESDICVIGAGAAGITIARALSDRPYKVALVEAGGFEYDDETQALYAGENVGHPYEDLDAIRLRFFGGTTNHWANYCRPLDHWDFAPRTWIPHSGWPIRKTDLEPYYPAAQELAQVGPYNYGADFWAEKLGLVRFRLNDAVIFHQATQIGPLTRFGEVYRADIETSDNVSAFLYLNALDFELNESDRAVTRLVAGTLTGNRVYVRSRFFVLACGGIENARLLLASDSRHTKGLGNEHDLVGRFFMEHFVTNAGIVALEDPSRDTLFYEWNPVGEDYTIRGVLRPAPEFQEQARTASAVAFLSRLSDPIAVAPGARSAVVIKKELEKGQLPSDLDRHLLRVISDLDEIGGFFLRQIGDGITGDKGGRGGWLGMRTVSEQVPNPDSRVLLSDERDALGMRRANLDWRPSPLDKRSILETCRMIGRELGRTGVGRLKVFLGDDETEWPVDLHWGYHHMGTTRMHDDPKQGVVDKDGKVHSFANLFVAGSSVFPTCGSAGPTLTIVALALRLADHLQQEFDS